MTSNSSSPEKSNVMQLKSYIWGYITGITVILLGVTPILALLFYSVDGGWSFSFIKSLVTSIQWTEFVGHIYPRLSTEVPIWIVLCVIILAGVLIVFKKSLGWYAHIYFLFFWVGFSSFWQDRWLSSKSTIELILIPFSALRPFSR